MNREELVAVMVKAAREAVTGYPHTQTLTFQMRAALASIEEAGMVVVPREPEHVDAHEWKAHDGAMVCSRCGLGYTNIPCIAAAPKPG